MFNSMLFLCSLTSIIICLHSAENVSSKHISTEKTTIAGRGLLNFLTSAFPQLTNDIYFFQLLQNEKSNEPIYTSLRKMLFIM